MDKHRNDDQRESGLPHLYDITKGQWIVTGTALATSGVVDLLAHNSTVAVVGLIATGIVAHQSNTILDMLVPGRDGARTVEATERVVNHLAPVVEEYADQSAGAKVRRLLGAKDPELYRTVLSAQEKPDEEEDWDLEDADGENDDEERIVPQQPTAARKKVARYHLDLGLTLHPHVNSIFSNRIVLLGMPGQGKSNIIAVFAEELGQYDAPFIIFDHKPEYGRLADRLYFRNPCQVDAQTVTPENATAFAQRMMDERQQVVLDLRSYRDDDAAAKVMIGIIDGVWAWEEAQGEQTYRVPCTFFLEEAHYWLPQNEQLSTVSRSRSKGGMSLLAQLQHTFFNLVNGGRYLGLGTIIATQRPANIDNRAIAVAEWKILLKANMPSDLRVYQGFGIDPEAAQALARGEAFVVGTDNIKQVHQFRRRRSPDDSTTPGVENLARRQSSQREIDAEPRSVLVPNPRLASVTFERNVAQPIPDVRPTSTTDDPARAGRLAAITNMRAAHFSDQEIVQLLGISEQEYQRLLVCLRRMPTSSTPVQTSRVSPSVPPSQASAVPLPASPSSKRPELHLVEGASEAERRDSEGDIESEGELPSLTEQERLIGDMYFQRNMNPNAIIRELYPDASGGNKYQQRSAEINDAIRKYVAAIRRGA